MPNGSNFTLGQANTATKPTVLNASVPNQPFDGNFRVATKRGGTAIMGRADGSSAIGVLGEGRSGFSTGVFGQADYISVFGLSITDAGDEGGCGVLGDGGDLGVVGNGLVTGVEGRGGDFGVWGKGTSFGGVFFGGVFVSGPLLVTGFKAAAIPHRDGSHRVVHSLECPESWFEDFGRARLRNGVARVKLDRDFASVVRATDYHVFVSAEGPSAGLFVARRTAAGFEVREQEGGRSAVEFSYRVVARRKDVKAERFARVKLPQASDKPPLPVAPRRRKRR